MATSIIGTIVQDYLPVLDNFKLQDPRWLLLAAIPITCLLVHVFRRQISADMNCSSEEVRDKTVVQRHRWPLHIGAACFLPILIGGIFLAAKPVNSTVLAQEQALLIWVYDASESMATVDVDKDGQPVSRLEAAVAALEESLPTVPPESYKLLVSFSGSDAVQVGLPTLSGNELLAQANEIPPGVATATDFGLERAVSACRQFFGTGDSYPCEIFLLSDGECNPRPSCRLRSEEIAAEAAETGIAIHSISWGDPESEYRPNPEDMRRIALAGGGQYLSSVSASELAGLYKNVATGLKVETSRQALADPIVWGARIGVILLGLGFMLWRFEQ